MSTTKKEEILVDPQTIFGLTAAAFKAAGYEVVTQKTATGTKDKIKLEVEYVQGENPTDLIQIFGGDDSLTKRVNNVLRTSAVNQKGPNAVKAELKAHPEKEGKPEFATELLQLFVSAIRDYAPEAMEGRPASEVKEMGKAAASVLDQQEYLTKHSVALPDVLALLNRTMTWEEIVAKYGPVDAAA